MNNMKIDLRLGDCLEVLKTIPDNSIDAVITDPPYGLSFMGKKWDYDVPSVEVWVECLRVLKPGGHLLSFAGSRTYHRMAVRIEDAGFEIRDQLMWVFGSGFPKSHNIGKAIQKQSGDIKVIGTKQGAGTTGKSYISNNEEYVDGEKGVFKKEYEEIEITNEWEGWGTALKPAHEPIVMARKPLSEKSIAENVLKHGTGGININGSRVELADNENGVFISGDKKHLQRWKEQDGRDEKNKDEIVNTPYIETKGRFPANIIFDEEAGQLLDEQTDKASRFFYCPKAAKSDRNEGLDDFEEKIKDRGNARKCKTCGKGILRGEGDRCECGENRVEDFGTAKNNHPTVKPTDLMRYLINLITPPNGTILDPFMGSGSTGKAAVRCGVNFIGIEKEQEYMDIASARIEHEKNKPIQTKLFDSK